MVLLSEDKRAGRAGAAGDRLEVGNCPISPSAAAAGDSNVSTLFNGTIRTKYKFDIIMRRGAGGDK